MTSNYICVSGKNSIAVSGISYVLRNYNKEFKIVALGDKNDHYSDSWQPSYLKFAKENNVKIIKLEDLYDIENLCFISLEYYRLIDPFKFKSNKLFNIHFSLLPAYRGMYTSAHPILNGDHLSGCTIHKIDSGIDTGPIISQKYFSISVKTPVKIFMRNI